MTYVISCGIISGHLWGENYNLVTKLNKKPNQMKNLLILLTTFLAVSFAQSQVINVVTLNGSQSSDPDGSIVEYTWFQVGTLPSLCTIANPKAVITTVVPAGGKQWQIGTYKFGLTCKDNLGATASDTMSVTVLPNPDKPPVVSVGSDKTVTLPTTSVLLTATASDPDGTIKFYQWSQITGPNVASFNRTDSAIVTVSGLIQGTYLFRCKVTDNAGASAADTISVIVKVNSLPASRAGQDQTITLPVSTVALGGVDTPDHLTVEWKKVLGRNAVFTSPNSSFTQVNNLQVGVYIFEKKVTDSEGRFAVDRCYVIVKAKAFKAF